MKKKIPTIVFLLLMAVVACNTKTKTAGENKRNKSFPPEMVEFEPYKGNPVFSGTGTNTWDKKIRERGYILFEDGVYKMWYTGYNSEVSKQKYLGYATSKDGINWSRYSKEPVFSDKWAEDMIVLRHEGIYYMYAEGDKDVAHLMVSPDGINWQEKGNLILLTTKGDTISGAYGTPSVWVEDEQWYLFYERDDRGIWLAKSDDKITWKNVQDEPVLKLGPDKYDIGAIAADQVVKYKGNYFLYYHATDRKDWQHPSSPVNWNSNVAMSSDLVHWEKYPCNPIVKGNHSSPILVFDGEKPSLYVMHPEVWRYSTK